jgi:hypothetical protein
VRLFISDDENRIMMKIAMEWMADMSEGSECPRQSIWAERNVNVTGEVWNGSDKMLKII